jgi:tRNA(Arg) A34 adenosine deaminase TadA
MRLSDEDYLRKAIDLARQARERGDDPFGALLVSADGEVLAEALNSVVTAKDCTGHAEINLMRAASQRFPREVLQAATLYTSSEPCPMCAGAIFWGSVGRIVFSVSGWTLRMIVDQNPANPTLAMPCGELLERGNRHIEVVGPLLEKEGLKVHEGYWK